MARIYYKCTHVWPVFADALRALTPVVMWGVGGVRFRVMLVSVLVDGLINYA